MIHQKVQVGGRTADGYVIPLGPVSIVAITTERGMVGCGAFDVAALDGFGYPAAKVRSAKGPIATTEDLLEGEVREANSSAARLGVKAGMKGLEALERLLSPDPAI